MSNKPVLSDVCLIWPDFTVPLEVTWHRFDSICHWTRCWSKGNF